jgi:cysteine-rich repeat protein
LIDELAIWTQQLNAAQIRNAMECGADNALASQGGSVTPNDVLIGDGRKILSAVPGANPSLVSCSFGDIGIAGLAALTEDVGSMLTETTVYSAQRDSGAGASAGRLLALAAQSQFATPVTLATSSVNDDWLGVADDFGDLFVAFTPEDGAPFGGGVYRIGRTCSGGENEGRRCLDDADCPGSTCGPTTRSLVACNGDSWSSDCNGLAPGCAGAANCNGVFPNNRFRSPSGVAVASDGLVYVVDRNAFGGCSAQGGCGGVIRVNPASGSQTRITNAGNFQDPSGIAVFPGVPACSVCLAGPSQGESCVSDAECPGSGCGRFRTPAAKDLEAGDLVVADPTARKVVLVDPCLGTQQPLFDQFPASVNPNAVSIDTATGDLLAASADGGTSGTGGIVYRLDYDPAGAGSWSIERTEASAALLLDPSAVTVAARGDGDGVPFARIDPDRDNCPDVDNHSQVDSDGDRRGDACDRCPGDALDDADEDTLCADADNCPSVWNPLVLGVQADLDEDGLGDACDPQTCGNGGLEPGEACDDGNATSGDGCDANCTVTACGNGVVTAGEACDDGNTTAADGCSPGCQIEPACGNGADDDGDGFSDFPADPGCTDAADASERGTAACDDGVDNDGDGFSDFPSDPGCVSPASGVEDPACNDGTDNDSDGLADLADPGCTGWGDGSELGVTACDDGVDNDGDGLADGADPGCVAPADTSEQGTAGCDDGADNDGDGLADLADPGCTGPADGSETGTATCDDGVDNDGDGLSDAADPGCAGPGDASEQGTAACDDGADNDFDGFADWADPGCAGPADGSEKGTLACDNGVDDDNDGLSDLADPGCAGPADGSERGTTVCDDGIDNDGDGLADYPADPGCAGPAVSLENPQCQDGLNNDMDGLIDWDGGASAGVPAGQQTAPDPDCLGQPVRNREKTGACGLGFELALLLPLLMRGRVGRRVLPR